jgi:TldD protein
MSETAQYEKIIQDTLFSPAHFDAFDLQKVFFKHLENKIDFADIYLQNTHHESWILEDSQVKRGHFAIDRGVGIRMINHDKTGFAFCDDIALAPIEEALKAAKAIGRIQSTSPIQIFNPKPNPKLYLPSNPILNMDSQSKIKLLHQIDELARQKDSRVTQVNASLSAEFDVIGIINSQGLVAGDVRPLISIHITVWMDENGKRETGRAGGGGRYDFHELRNNQLIEKLIHQAIHEANINLSSIPAPAGEMPVVLGSGWPGILLHEAVGHGLEGDFNRKETSTFSNRIGEQVAAKGVTVVDNGTIENRRGSLNIDDEGTPTQNTVLIQDGVLVNYMQDLLNARLMGMQTTGNCRRESYSCMPMPRMTNTYMMPGAQTKEEIIASVKKGIYAVNFGGGQVDITSGQFVFSTSEAYLIENGKVTQPIKGATLIGNGPEVMKHISMIGQDLNLDPGIGICGKNGQSVPVGVGQPTIKIDKIIVGGSQTT